MDTNTHVHNTEPIEPGTRDAEENLDGEETQALDDETEDDDVAKDEA